MPHYRITTKGEEKPRWIKATSAAAAIRHCAEGMFKAETMTNVEDAADLAALGVKMESAGEGPAEPERKAEPELPAFIRHGDQIDGIDQGGPYPARINLKAKVVEIKRGPGNSNADWGTLRDATDEEIAAETERTAK